MKNFNLPALGGGAGLRAEHFDEVLATRPPFRWVEVIAEDCLGLSGPLRDKFQQLAALYRIIPHGVGLSIGSTEPLNREHLRAVRRFLDEVNAPWFSDHLCFTMVDHANLESLIPVPLTTEAAHHIASRIEVVQNELARPFLLENVARNLTVARNELSESEFIATILERANCGLLLDVSNVLLNARNDGFEPHTFLRNLPLHRIGQMHIAGWDGESLEELDSYESPTPPDVWNLFQHILTLTGPSSVLIEWDKSVPPVSRLLLETQTTDAALRQICGWSPAV